jgi:hypothetical protein
VSGAAVAEHLAAIPGTPESAMAPAGVEALPAPAPAPWDVVLEAVVWVHRATPAARDLLPPALRGHRTLPLGLGALVRYLDTPVGPYSEVLASPVLVLDGARPAVHIPFIAVDALASVAGGRANWSLPKVLARFAWPAEPGDLAMRRGLLRASAAGACEDGAPWSVAVQAGARGPLVPVAAAGRAVQATPGGALLRTPVHVRGHARAAAVGVRATGPTLPAWLPAGRHAGLVLQAVRGHVAAPR